MPEIKITVTKAGQTLSDNVSKSIKDVKSFKYTYLKQAVSRIRLVTDSVADETDEQKVTSITNALIVERNVANFAAEQYAKLNQDEIFNDLMEIVEEIDELLKP